jgi:hypothetical protein
VAELLDHRNIEITRGYFKVEKALNKNANNVDFHTKVAKTQGEIIQLLDGGFDYILEKDGLAYFRKRR